LRSWAEFEGPLRKALHRLKYENDLGLGNEFSTPLLQIIQREGWVFDYVIPIPVSKTHHKARGYNQAAVIAKPIALALGIPMFEKAVIRIKETQSQVKLSREERFKNLYSAFLGNSAKLLNKKVLLVDDITTTGATLISCSQTLREFGCTQIFCITVARTIKYNQ
jgi:ComF family protein